MRRAGARLTSPAVVVALTGLLTACGEDGGEADDEPAATEPDGDDTAAADPDEGEATGAPAGGETVTAASFAFQPPELSVAEGTTVTFVNEDAARHTFTSGEGEADGTFDLAAAEGESAEFTFDDAGTYPYFCQVHPSMTGTITVE